MFVIIIIIFIIIMIIVIIYSLYMCVCVCAHARACVRVFVCVVMFVLFFVLTLMFESVCMLCFERTNGSLRARESPRQVCAPKSAPRFPSAAGPAGELKRASGSEVKGLAVSQFCVASV